MAYRLPRLLTFAVFLVAPPAVAAPASTPSGSAKATAKPRATHPFMMAQAVRVGAGWEFKPGVYLRGFGEIAMKIAGTAITVKDVYEWSSLPVSGIFGVQLTGLFGQLIGK